MLRVWALLAVSAVGCRADDGRGSPWAGGWSPPDGGAASDDADDDDAADDDDDGGDDGAGHDVPEPPDPAASTGGDEPPPPANPKEALCQALQGLPPPALDPAAIVDDWQAFVAAYPDRHHGAANNLAAAQFLDSQLSSMGYDTQVLELSSSSGTVRVVEGLLAGSAHSDRWVGLGAHYDVVPNTVQGAYDNASGVAVQLKLCELLADAHTEKSIACLFFDAEEIGRVGSERYVAQFVQSGAMHFDQFFGYDMVGLNWPGMSWKLYLSMGLEPPALQPHNDRHVAHLSTALFDCLGDELALPPSGVEIIPYYDKRSDEERFMDAGVPIVRFAGGRDAADYGGYHNSGDTVSKVFDVAGGRAGFEEGIATAIEVSYYAILAFDAYDPMDLPDLSE